LRKDKQPEFFPEYPTSSNPNVSIQPSTTGAVSQIVHDETNKEVSAPMGVRVVEKGVIREPSAHRRRKASGIKLDNAQMQNYDNGMNVLERLEKLKLDLAVEQRRVAKDLHLPSTIHTSREQESYTRPSVGGGSDYASHWLPSTEGSPYRNAPKTVVDFHLQKSIGRVTSDRPDSRVSSLNLDALEKLNAARLSRLAVQ
jgi:hypothetical protein